MNKFFIKKNIFLFLFLFLFLLSIFVYFFFSIEWHCFTFYLNWFNYLNINYSFNIDSFSLFFILLSTFLFFICLLISWNSITYNFISFCFILFFTEIFIINFFLMNDLFLFFLFFESILLPMYLLIGIWGSNLRKIYASYQLFFFTLFGSIFMFFAILIFHISFGTTDFMLIQIYNYKIINITKLLLFIFLFLAFAIKIPIVPLHFWLPEAHVEAPTAGSVILAGLLLKLGAYGFVRFLIPLFSDIIIFLNPILVTICIYSIVYISFIILRQLDLKKIIAYSSIIHMNFILLGLIFFNKNTLLGSIFLLLSHGIVSSALFICIGFLYERYHTRIILYYKGISIIMPLFVFFFFFFILANASLPGTSNFTGEFLVLLGIFEYNKFIIFFLILGLFYSAVVNFWIYNKIVFGDIKKSYIKYSNDLSFREFSILIFFFFLCLIMGYYPMIIFSYLKYYVFLLLIL